MIWERWPARLEHSFVRFAAAHRVFISVAPVLTCPGCPAPAAEYVHTCAHDTEEVPEVRDLANKTWHAMKRTAKAGQRRTLPDMQVGQGRVRCGLGASGFVWLQQLCVATAAKCWYECSEQREVFVLHRWLCLCPAGLPSSVTGSRSPPSPARSHARLAHPLLPAPPAPCRRLTRCSRA